MKQDDKEKVLVVIIGCILAFGLLIKDAGIIGAVAWLSVVVFIIVPSVVRNLK